jgi:hypothetical protein
MGRKKITEMPMNIRFSRHARSRMKLYGIEQTDVELTISHPQQQLPDGDNIIATRGFENKYSGYPLKAVYCRTDNDILVVTVYPLKKKREEL